MGVARNKKWVEKINEYSLKNKSIFVFVGVSHLPGKEGLLKLLANTGYTLSPIKPHRSAESERHVIKETAKKHPATTFGDISKKLINE